MMLTALPSCEVAASAAYAAWPTGELPLVSIALSAAEPLAFGERLPLKATVTSKGGDITISRFLEATQGIAFDVRDAEGRPVCPAEPPPWSPPPPPPSDQSTVLVTPSTPYQVQLNEPGRWVLPGPGRYTVRAVLFLWGPGADRSTANYTSVSEPLIVEVRP